MAPEFYAIEFVIMIKNIIARPRVINGLLAGLVLISIKLILAYTGHWMFRLETVYNMMSFLIIVVAMIMGNFGERKIAQRFNFGDAWLSAVIVTSIAVFISLIGDQIAYRTVAGLAEKTKEYNLDQLVKGFGKMNFVSGNTKELLITEAEKMDPTQIYSVSSTLVSWVTFVFLNSIWALLVASITRKKANPLSNIES